MNSMVSFSAGGRAPVAVQLQTGSVHHTRVADVIGAPSADLHDCLLALSPHDYLGDRQGSNGQHRHSLDV
jgi:hypothetical protein